MKMKHFFKYAMMFVAVIMSVVCISSCSKDDKSDPISTNKIVGKWKYTFGENSYALLTFKSDGTGHAFEYDDGSIDEDEDFYYTYDDDTEILTFFVDGEQYKCHITWINNKTFSSDILDRGSIWIKQ